MSPKSFEWHISLFLFTFIVLADLGYPSPTIVKDDHRILENLEELDDLNKNNSILRDSSLEKTPERPFVHRDEDMIADLRESAMFASSKYDVEILESSEMKKEDVEIEERYRGPAITLDTDNFIKENIEINANEDETENITKETIGSGHLILGIILVIVALVSIGLYSALIIWRTQMKQRRYGMPELLVSNDNEDYWPQDVISSVVAQHQQQYQQQQRQHQQIQHMLQQRCHQQFQY